VLINEDVNTGAEAFNLPAQRGPDEAAERPRRGGAARVPSQPRGARRGRGSAPLGSYRISHSKEIERFKNYLSSTKDYRFRLSGTDTNGEVVVIIPFIHRWTDIYRMSILAKFYKLDDWMRNNPGIVSMFTLTVYQGSQSRYNDGSYSRKVVGKDLTILDCFNLLKVCRAKFLNVLRNRYPGINYVWVLEPHETGFPHNHLVVFREFTEAEQNTIKQLWSKKYRAGSYDRGIDITSKRSDKSIQSIRNYLMKYMTKQFGSGEEPWTDDEILFNAMVWVTSTRMWGASKNLTAIMRRPEKKSDVTWNLVELLMPGGQIAVWSRDDETPFPNLNYEPYPDDLCPEGDVTKQFWRTIYREREQWRKSQA
jgi:hypothetical protein